MEFIHNNLVKNALKNQNEYTLFHPKKLYELVSSMVNEKQNLSHDKEDCTNYEHCSMGGNEQGFICLTEVRKPVLLNLH